MLTYIQMLGILFKLCYSDTEIVLINHTTAQHVPAELSTIPRHKFEITGIG